MLQSDTGIEGTFATVGGQDEPAMDFAPEGATKTIADKYQAEIKGLFKTVPVCPDAENSITVTITKATDSNSKATVATACTDTDTHVVPGTADDGE